MILVERIFETLLVAAVSFSGAYAVVSVLILAHELLLNRRKRVKLSPAPPVSILKPLKGLDDQLEQNLRSFFELDYSDFQLVFGVNDPADPSISIVQSLLREYPVVNATLVVDSRVRALNPKINNLRNMYPEARHDYIVISDSNVRVEAGYLHDLMRHMQKNNVGLVTSTIRGIGARTLAGVFENLHLGSFVATSVFAVRRLFRVPVVIGKSMLLRRTTIAQLGGFEAYSNFLAEDQLIGMGVRELGYKIRTSTQCIDNVNESWTWDKFLNRHIRWGKMRRNLDVANYTSEVLSHPLALASAYLAYQHNFNGLKVFLAIMAIKYLCDTMALLMLRSDLRIYHLLFLPLKDLMMFVIWFIPFFDRKINWRGHQFTIEHRTELQRVAIAEELGSSS